MSVEDLKKQRLSQFKATFFDCQVKRRNELLKHQEQQRNSLLDSHRHLIENIEEHPNRAKKKRNGLRSLGKMLMLSEWFVHPPENVDTSWVFMFCPKGKRCILRAQKGKTIAVTKRGKLIRSFESSLPGGGFHNGTSLGAITILDCIYNSATDSFYILDVLHWNDHALVGTDSDFRQFWIHSRIREELSLGREKADFNTCAIVPLETYPCTLSLLEEKMTEFPNFPNNQPSVDGILFRHREAYYTKGKTPLMGWLKPFMLPEVFDNLTSIHNNYYLDRPSEYINYLEYISDFIKESNRLAGKQTKKEPDIEMCESESFESVDDVDKSDNMSDDAVNE